MRALALLALAACAGAAPDAADTGLCAGAPTLTWENFGAGFITQECQACHASSTLDRHGAPEAMTFDDEAQVRGHAQAILAVATGDSPRMPPEGGVPEEDLRKLEIWLLCE